jgi:hypothetical protein
MKRWSIVSSMFDADLVPVPSGMWRSWGRAWAIVGIALAWWVAASWYFVDRYESGLTESYLRRERINAERDIHSINTGVTSSWQIAQGFLATLAHQDMLRASLDRRDAEAAKQAIKRICRPQPVALLDGQ